MVSCAGCDRPILERFLLNVLDQPWHVRCVQCTDCKCSLSDKCFSREGKLFCRQDFFRRFGTKCAGCSLGISPNDLVRKARNKVFHLRCFTCMLCRRQLSTGEELYIVGENKFMCKEDYLQNRFEGSDGEDEMDFMDTTLEQQADKDLSLENKSDISLSKDPLVPESNNSSNNSNNNTISNKNDVNSSLNHNNNNNNKVNSHYHKNNNSSKGNNNSQGSCPSPSKLEPVLTDPIQAMKMESVLPDPALPPTPPSPDINMNCSITPGSDNSSVDINDNGSCGDINDNDEVNDNNGNPSGAGSKRRGPRTTIKAKQLEVLKAAFNATPKPTRHIREQLAQETGLNMRVIQVWFQNRRSKERRMKQLSALGARRHFYRSPRRMRGLRGGPDMDETDMMGPGYGYFNENEQEMYPGFPGFPNNFFPGQGPDGPGNMNFLPPNARGTPPHMEPGMIPRGMVPDGQFMPSDILPPCSSPDSLPMNPDEGYLGNGPGRPMNGHFTSLPHLQHRPEMAGEVW